jgi:hypothetical protein
MAVTAQTLFIEPYPPVRTRCFVKLDRDGISRIPVGFENTGCWISQSPFLNRFSKHPFYVCNGYQGTRGGFRAEQAG